MQQSLLWAAVSSPQLLLLRCFTDFMHLTGIRFAVAVDMVCLRNAVFHGFQQHTILVGYQGCADTFAIRCHSWDGAYIDYQADAIRIF